MTHLKEVSGNYYTPNYLPPAPGEQRRSVISPKYDQATLGWVSKVNKTEGLKSTYDWFKK